MSCTCDVMPHSSISFRSSVVLGEFWKAAITLCVMRASGPSNGISRVLISSLTKETCSCALWISSFSLIALSADGLFSDDDDEDEDDNNNWCVSNRAEKRKGAITLRPSWCIWKPQKPKIMIRGTSRRYCIVQTSTPTASLFTSKRRLAHFFKIYVRSTIPYLPSVGMDFLWFLTQSHKVDKRIVLLDTTVILTIYHTFDLYNTIVPYNSSRNTNITKRAGQSSYKCHDQCRIAKSKNINFTNWPLVNHSALGHIHMNIDM